jgi:hypothetical protein
MLAFQMPAPHHHKSQLELRKEIGNKSWTVSNLSSICLKWGVPVPTAWGMEGGCQGRRRRGLAASLARSPASAYARSCWWPLAGARWTGSEGGRRRSKSCGGEVDDDCWGRRNRAGVARSRQPIWSAWAGGGGWTADGALGGGWGGEPSAWAGGGRVRVNRRRRGGDGKGKKFGGGGGTRRGECARRVNARRGRVKGEPMGLSFTLFRSRDWEKFVT